MAEILPIKAWKYNPELGEQIEELVSPLFDVVSEKQRKRLYENDYCSIHLSVPLGDQAADFAAKRLQKWKDEGILIQDQIPGIYVYYQYFTLAGSHKEYCRKGFICNIKAYDWDEKVVLRHENTMPHSVNDRLEILEKTNLNVSATHGLYADSEKTLDSFMDEAIASPIYETEDYQGVKDVLGVIHDLEVIKKFVQKVKDQQIILADGHHRYEGSMAYRKAQMDLNPNHTGNEGYNYHLMYLTNSYADDLRVLPTHRLITGLPDFDEKQVLKALEEFFIIREIEEPYTINEIILGKQWAFGLLFKDKVCKLRLKPEVHGSISWKFPQVVKNLDLTVLHYFVFEKVLGILGKDQRSSPYISFDRNFTDCLTKVIREEVQMAFITNDISMDEIKNVCDSGYTMPQKSTSFYPKTICGFLFSSIHEDEFQSPVNTSF
jgi:uncharacterized protein (DUF1015 family)